MNSNELVAKFNDLKVKHTELMAEKAKYEAKKEQLASEIKLIQSKYPEYDLSTTESVEKIIKDLTEQLDNELNTITEQYMKLQAV